MTRNHLCATPMAVVEATVLLLIAVAPAQGQSVIATVPVGQTPISVAVNPVTNKIYVSNWGSGNISVIDGATNSTTTISDPNAQYVQGVRVNPVTNKIYVANFNGCVTVIDGATNSITTVTDPNAGGSHFVAVNSVTNKIYVANWYTNNVTVIDGATNSTVSVPTGANPQHLAVNPVTNKIYVPNWGSGEITVIDGATNHTTTIKDPNATTPSNAGVNSLTNKIYVSNYSSNNVTVIDGATNSLTTVTDPQAIHPGSVSVNPVTNKVYVVNGGTGPYAGSSNVTVIDGVTNYTTTVTDPNANDSNWLVVDSATNKVYVANWGSNNVTVIDGATNSTKTVTDPNAIHPAYLDLDPATNRVYVINGGGYPYGGSNNVTVIAGASAASKYKILHVFTWGSMPTGNLTLDVAGNLYGTTAYGGCHGCGTVFKLTHNSDGTRVSTLHSFNCADGFYPNGGLIFDKAGNLYGTTYQGGATNWGVAFKLTHNPNGSWTEKVLHNFTGTDGIYPEAGLVIDPAGNLYGTTVLGGVLSCYVGGGCGVVFKLKPNPDGSWTESGIHSFTQGDGNEPYGLLTRDAAGNLYGTTELGGSYGDVFKLTPNPDGSWTETVIHNFTFGDGFLPHPGVTFDAAGNLYGTTRAGVYGTFVGDVFKLTPDPDGTWAGSVLYSFTGGEDGSSPWAGVVVDSVGNVYGTTVGGGGAGYGVVFKLTPTSNGWSETVLHSFAGVGKYPYGGLVMDAAGNLYGTTSAGTNNNGLVFEITP